MITKEEFIKLLDENKLWAANIDKIEDILGAHCLFDTTVIQYGQKLFETIIEHCFDRDGIDIIYWWLYDFVSPKTITYPNGNKVEIKTHEELWDVVKDYLIR